MKTDKLEKWILLDQTGELSVRNKRRLDRELEASSEARRLRDDLNRLTSAVPPADAEPGPWAAQQIHARLSSEPEPLLGFSWKPVLPLAAGLVVAAVFWTARFDSNTSSAIASSAPTEAEIEEIVWEDPLAEDLEELETLILAISESPLDIMKM